MSTLLTIENFGVRPPTVATMTVLALLTGVMSGCVAKFDETRVAGPAHPVASGEREVAKESEERAPTVQASTSGDVIDVAINSTWACRSVDLVPMGQEDTIKRQTTGAYGFTENKSPNFWNVVGVLLLGGVGAGTALGKCIGDGTNPCSPAEANGQKTAGIVVMSTAAIPLTIIVINAIRTTDSTETVSLPKERRPRPWSECGTKPIAGRKVDVSVGRAPSLSALTNSNGHVLFDLGNVDLIDEVVPSTANVLIDGSTSSTVDITAMPSRARWERQVSQARAARLEAERKQADDLAWERTPSAGCMGPAPTDPDLVEASCASVQRYLSDFPTGEHNAEARRLVASGPARVAKLRAEIEKGRRDAATAQKREENLARRREAEDRERRVSGCRGGCVPQCKGRSDFVPCVQKCQSSCGP